MTALRLILAGAAIGNGNHGVEALSRSVADSVDADAPGGHLMILDDEWGLRREPSGRYRRAAVDLAGVRLSRRWHRLESWARVRMAQAFGDWGNLLAQRIRTADALLDISGGDSFTDLYGEHRFAAVRAPKEAAVRADTPLVFLPQTYGPFETPEGRRHARRLVRGATVAYARDTRSLRILEDLAGPDADGSRIRAGVDVAFAMRRVRPRADVAAAVDALGVDGDPVVGINVSGLLRDPDARERFGLAGDYVATMIGLVDALVTQAAKVLFVPHVHVQDGRGESDIATIRLICSALERYRSRLAVVPTDLDAAELKWCVSQVSWFVGSRMHSTIAALSCGVPAFGYAYSDKTIGVFETCGAGGEVADARRVTGPAAVEAMLAAFERRHLTRQYLSGVAPAINEQARRQLGDLFGEIASWREASPGALG